MAIVQKYISDVGMQTCVLCAVNEQLSRTDYTVNNMWDLHYITLAALRQQRQ